MKIVNQKEFDEIIKEGVTFVDFYADWCGPCKMLAPIVEDIAQDYPEMEFVKVNVDNDEDLAVRYGIMSIPSLFVIKDGEVLGSKLGYMNKDALKNFIDGVIG